MTQPSCVHEPPVPLVVVTQDAPLPQLVLELHASVQEPFGMPRLRVVQKPPPPYPVRRSNVRRFVIILRNQVTAENFCFRFAPLRIVGNERRPSLSDIIARCALSKRS